MSVAPGSGAQSIPPAVTPAPPRKRRIWRWALLILLLLIGSCSVLCVRFFVRGVSEARSVAEAQLPVVTRITANWDLDALYQVAGPELKQAAPESVARAYFDAWRKLGPSQSLAVVRYYFKSYTSAPTIVTATYAGQYQHGTATLEVRFKESGGSWIIVSFNVADIVLTDSPTTGPTKTP